MKRLLFILTIAVSLCWIAIHRTDGFDPSIIQGPLTLKNEGKIDADLISSLGQEFTYLGKGRQSFVFVSADQKIVIKFFNHKYFNMPLYGFLFENKERKKRERRRLFYENSYRIAKNVFGEEILYLHQGPTEALPILTCKDRASRLFSIDLNQTPFVLQRKGTPFYEYLSCVAESEGINGLKAEIDGYIEAVCLRIEKGIGDADSDVEHNWGVIDGKLFHLDPGRLYYEKELNIPEELNRATRKFKKWLLNEYPEAASYLDEKIQRITLEGYPA